MKSWNNNVAGFGKHPSKQAVESPWEHKKHKRLMNDLWKRGDGVWNYRKRQEGWGEQDSLNLSCSFDSLSHYSNICLKCSLCLFVIAVAGMMQRGSLAV